MGTNIQSFRLSTLARMKADAMEIPDPATVAAIDKELERRIAWSHEFQTALLELDYEDLAALNGVAPLNSPGDDTDGIDPRYEYDSLGPVVNSDGTPTESTTSEGASDVRGLAPR